MNASPVNMQTFILRRNRSWQRWLILLRTRPRRVCFITPQDWKGSLLNPKDVDQLAASISKSAGTFAVPVGLDFKGAASSVFTGDVTVPPDLTQVTIALVASDGTFAHVATAGEMTDANLRKWIDALS